MNETYIGIDTREVSMFKEKKKSFFEKTYILHKSLNINNIRLFDITLKIPHFEIGERK